MRSAALVVLVLLLAGCAAQPDPPADQPVPTTEPTATPASPTPPSSDGDDHNDGVWRFDACAGPTEGRVPSNLVVAQRARNGSIELRLAHPDRAGWRIDLREGLGLSPAADGSIVVGATDDHLYAVIQPRDQDGPVLARLSRDLDVLQTAPVGSVASIAITSSHVFLAGENLTVFDHDLEQVGEVELPLKVASTTGAKMAHGMLVTGDRVHLIDDVVGPLFVLVVNVSDPARPAVIARNNITGQHLPAHWLDANGEWIVLSTFGGYQGSSLTAHILDAQTARQNRSIPVHASRRIPIVEETGHNIDGGALPWALLSGGGERFFGRVSLDMVTGGLRACGVPLEPAGKPDPTAADGTLGRHQDLVTLRMGGELLVLDVASGGPVVTARGPIPESLVLAIPFA